MSDPDVLTEARILLGREMLGMDCPSDVDDLCDMMERLLAHCAAQEVQIATLTQERNEARQYGERLYRECAGNARQVTCVYCGHKFKEGVPSSQDERLTEHIRVCEKHPMREAEAQIAALRQELADAESQIAVMRL